MSDEEREEVSVAQEELDDLFGESGGEDQDQDQDQETKSDSEEQQSQSTSKRNRVDYDSQNEGSNDDDEEEEEEEVEKKVLEISLPRHAVSSISEGTKILKTPAHLKIEPRPFDPNKFKDEVEYKMQERKEQGLTSKQIYNEQLAEKLINETTIRWRYHNSGNDEIIKQSNAHFVQWNDGSVSLKIGNEMFDVKSLPVVDNLLVRSHKTAEFLQTDSIIESNINLLPASTNSIHKRLLQVMKNVQFKDKILSTTTEVDPLMKQRIEDENEKKKLKMKRMLEAKRRLQEQKWERGDSPAVGGSRAYSAYADEDEDDDDYGVGGGRGGAAEEYDEEDDFVAGDEEEVEQYDDEDEEEEEEEVEEQEEEFEKGAERLRKLKEEGAARYREASVEEETRKRRRIIDSDEDDE
ncbi:Paf1 complex component [Lodderomyces elongisporus]|uniref:Paf1 complex component n=1 Tax=Lodderomyces elongisporus TaxID=36914 RepID=UPI0029258CA6|nr:Paf1 complex component [Lodderomyces elongisporus]WLF79409.1 Paf1 complex component [Lodderomyces elongisporus]